MHKHRRQQIVVTTGVVTTSALAAMFPSQTVFVLVVSGLVNLIWIWGE